MEVLAWRRRGTYRWAAGCGSFTGRTTQKRARWLSEQRPLNKIMLPRKSEMTDAFSRQVSLTPDAPMQLPTLRAGRTTSMIWRRNQHDEQHISRCSSKSFAERSFLHELERRPSFACVGILIQLPHQTGTELVFQSLVALRICTLEESATHWHRSTPFCVAFSHGPECPLRRSPRKSASGWGATRYESPRSPTGSSASARKLQPRGFYR